MKPQGLLLLLSLAVLTPIADGRGASFTPQYRFAPNVTNVYEVRIAVVGEAKADQSTGLVFVAAQPLSGQQVTLTFQGQIRPKGYTPGAYIPSSSRSMATIPYISLAADPRNGTAQITIDGRGDILRRNGDVALLIPLGSLMESLIELLPDKARSSWKRESRVVMLDEPNFYGPSSSIVPSSITPIPEMGYSISRSRPAILTGELVSEVTAKVKGTESITLNRKQTLEALINKGAEPRVLASSTATYVLDYATRVPKQVEIEGEMTANTENVSRKNRSRLVWRLLEGEERLAALRPSVPQTPAPAPLDLNPQSIAAVIEQLKSDDVNARRNALGRLLGVQSQPFPEELLGAIRDLTTAGDDSTRQTAMTLLAARATKADLPKLLIALKDSNNSVRSAAIGALKRLADPSSADSLSALIASGYSNHRFPGQWPVSDAAEALIAIGPEAEKFALQLLDQKHQETQREACLVLARIGSKQSVEKLQKLVASPEKLVSDAAAEAIRFITAREQ